MTIYIVEPAAEKVIYEANKGNLYVICINIM